MQVWSMTCKHVNQGKKTIWIGKIDIVVAFTILTLFNQTFEKLFIICAKVLIKSEVQLSSFELQTFHDNNLKLRQLKHTTLFHNIDKIMFIIFYNNYLLKF